VIYKICAYTACRQIVFLTRETKAKVGRELLNKTTPLLALPFSPLEGESNHLSLAGRDQSAAKREGEVGGNDMKLFTTITLLSTLVASIAHANPDQIDLATLDTFTGTSTSNTPGVDQGVMTFGDFNCDGTKDLIFSSPFYATNKGRLYVKFGKSISGTTSLSYTTMSWTVLGDATARYLGGYVQSADVDNDGCDDIIVGAQNNSTGYDVIYTFLGDSSRGLYSSVGAYYTLNSTITPDYTLTSTTLNTEDYAHLLGAIDGAAAGQHLAICSDSTGKCYLIPVANLMNTTSTIEDEASYYIQDGIGGYSIEDALASGDIDGDGSEDLIAGDAGEDQVTIFFGPLSTSPSKLGSSSDYYFNTNSVSGNATYGEDVIIADTATIGFGSTVAISNVITNSTEDENADVIIGALDATVDGVTTAGRYDVICGQSLKNLRDSVTLTTGMTIYTDTSTGTYNYGDLGVIQYGGDDTSAELGIAGNTSAQGDLNGDGIKDFIAGGSQYAGSADNGRLYVIYGGEFQDLMGTEIVLTDSNYTSELYVEGANAGDELANNVVSGGDITGDGIDDAVVAASGYNTSFGITYVLEGAPTDWDSDGHYSILDNDGDGIYETVDDCNDKQATIYVGATETANDFDDDCDGTVDEDTSSYDDDGDGQTEDAGDCNDASAAINTSATETCDSVDNDCDGSTDEGVTTTYYQDSDGDTYGSASSTSAACSVPAGYVTNDDDCDDTSAGISPIDVEIADDGIDQDCSGADLSSSTLDSDGDGYTGAGGDCNDAAAAINPGAIETCDSVDNDCDGSTDEGVTTTYYQDSDGDTYGDAAVTSSACSAPASYVTNDDDCDDASAGISPVDVEIADDGIDQDCSGADLVSSATDADSDGSDSTADCNDGDATIYPGATETCDDGIDQDCDGSDTVCSTGTDADADGVDSSVDCDDTDATVYPGATELADTLDNDCDSREDEGLVDVQLTSYTTSVNVGDVIPVEYTITNTSGFENFRMDVLINNTASASTTWPYFPRGLGASFCSSTRCTELDESTLTVPVSTTSTNTVNVTIPALSAGSYVFRVRVYNDDSGQYFDRDINQQITVN